MAKKNKKRRKVTVAERLRNIQRSEKKEEASKKYGILQIESNAQYAGVAFSETDRLKVFEYYWRNKGNISAVRRKLAEDKVLENGRVPSHGTIRQWAEENNWNLVSMMVDEGLLEALEFKNNPEIANFINQKASYFLVLREISQNIYQRMMKPGDPLFPRNNKDAVSTVKFLIQEMREIFPEMLEGRIPEMVQTPAKGARPSQTDNAEEPEKMPDNVTSIAMALAAKGEEVSEEAIAREMIRNRNSG